MSYASRQAAEMLCFAMFPAAKSMVGANLQIWKAIEPV